MPNHLVRAALGNQVYKVLWKGCGVYQQRQKVQERKGMGLLFSMGSALARAWPRTLFTSHLF